ncbi:MAG: hypothetical protein A2W93_13300 [Bacteroidetes bacterium GWF2_43_63]|nr:MAG: hypothetical protein A2W93_13300 [Bacteroidetes bacterium GWF2_43_63]HBG70221.1 hypothetical protein [Bacteroidales bacterium]
MPKVITKKGAETRFSSPFFFELTPFKKSYICNRIDTRRPDKPNEVPNLYQHQSKNTQPILNFPL